MKRVLFVDHVNRILGGAEINLLELLSAAAAAQNWTVACACVRDGLLSRRLAEMRILQWNYGFDPALNTFRLVGKKLSFVKGVRTMLALREGRQMLADIIAQFHPDAVVTCTNKDHFVRPRSAAVCPRRLSGGSTTLFLLTSLPGRSALLFGGKRSGAQAGSWRCRNTPGGPCCRKACRSV